MRLIYTLILASIFFASACEPDPSISVDTDAEMDGAVDMDGTVDVPDTGVDSGTDAADAGVDANMPDTGMDADTDAMMADADMDAGVDANMPDVTPIPFCGDLITNNGEDCDGGANCEADCTWTRWICADSVVDTGSCSNAATPAPCNGETIASIMDYNDAAIIGIFSLYPMPSSTSPLNTFPELPDGILGKKVICSSQPPIVTKARYCVHYGAQPSLPCVIASQQ